MRRNKKVTLWNTLFPPCMGHVIAKERDIELDASRQEWTVHLLCTQDRVEPPTQPPYVNPFSVFQLQKICTKWVQHICAPVRVVPLYDE